MFGEPRKRARARSTPREASRGPRRAVSDPRGSVFLRARGRKMPPARGWAGGATTRGGRETHPLRVPRRLSVSAMVFS